MCTKGINIGEAELEIMKAIWRAEEPIGSAAIGEAVKGKGWKRTTIATFLAHLAEKGAIGAERRGKAWYYTPILTEKEYRRMQVKKLVKNVFNGSARDLVASLFEEKALSDDDVEELKSIFKED